MSERKVVYSTKKEFTTNANETKLKEVSERFKQIEVDRISSEFDSIIENMNEGSDQEFTFIHVDDFVSCWEFNLKTLIRSGEDLIAKNDNRRSIFSLWESQTGSLNKGFVICDYAYDNVGTRAIRPLYYTPSLGMDSGFNPEMQKLDLHMIHGKLSLLKQNKLQHEFMELSRDTIVKVTDVVKSNDGIESRADKFKRAWEAFFSWLDGYKKKQQADFIEDNKTQTPKEEIKQQSHQTNFYKECGEDLFEE